MIKEFRACLIIDEVYTYILSKNNRYYIWTALIIMNGKKYPIFYLSKHKSIDDLDRFMSQLDYVSFEKVYSDKNPTYKDYFSKKNVAEKGIITNLIESLNSQLRHYCSSLLRRSRHHAKSEFALHDMILNLFFAKLIPSIN